MALHSLARQRFVAYYLQLASENRNDLTKVASDLDNILRAADFCVELSDWKSLRELTAALNDYLLRLGEWKNYIKFNALLVTNYPAEPTDEKIGRLGQLAEIEEMRGNYSEVLRWSKCLVQLHAENPNHNIDAAIRALKRLSRLTAAPGRYDEAMEYLKQGISIAREGLPKDEVDLLFEFALLHKKRLDIDIARELSVQSLEKARTIGYFTKEVDILSLLASVDVLQNHLPSALNQYQEVLASARAMGDTVREDAILAEITRVRGLIKLDEDRKRRIFISYNHEDRGFVERLARDLKAHGLSVWWDQWEIKVGDSIIQKVSDGIAGSAYLISVLSPGSVKSEWVQREIGSVLMKQLSAEKNITILPLLLADCEVPVLLREIKWADFRGDYESGLKSLLETLLVSI